jgi:putative membrane protein
MQNNFTKKQKKWLVGICLGLMLFAFLPVFFIQNPDKLPFSIQILIGTSQIHIVFFALPLFWGCWLWLKKDVWKLGVLMGYAWMVESLAIYTHWPYGEFVYSELMGTKAVTVPWSMPFSWLPVLFLAVVMVNNIRSVFGRVILGALFMTSFDLVLDPGATRLGFWIWAEQGGWYGVPWMNFFGWLVVSAGGLMVWELVKPKKATLSKRSQRSILLSGIISLSFWTGVSLWMGFLWPALIGVMFLFFVFRKF